MVSVPTMGEQFAKFLHHMGEAQSCAAMLAHLYRDDTKGRKMAIGWLAVEQQLKLTVSAVTALATKGLQ